jgi:hypothetical protein
MNYLQHNNSSVPVYYQSINIQKTYDAEGGTGMLAVEQTEEETEVQLATNNNTTGKTLTTG